ncbi:receptor-like serine/threonine kinase, partial [Trifolium medium]|nr:receptor-like serine/threonine kinase [Trifolium medium]
FQLTQHGITRIRSIRFRFHRHAAASAPPPPADPSSDPSSPYYVHSSDGPSSVKVMPLLNGSNYHSWARSMRHALGT